MYLDINKNKLFRALLGLAVISIALLIFSTESKADRVQNNELLNPQGTVYDFTFQSDYTPQNNPVESYSKIKYEVEKILGHIPRTFKTNTCGTDSYGTNYCNEALSECAQEWDYADGYSVEHTANVIDYTNKITTTKEVCSTNTGVRMYSNCGSQRNYFNAVSYCNNLIEGGYSDWRLPTLGETATSSGMGGNGVPSCSGWTWTFTVNHGYIRYVWSGSTVNGYYIGGINGYYVFWVRCVR